MLTLLPNLALLRCPHCQIDNPNLTNMVQQSNGSTVFQTNDQQGTNSRQWKVYKCVRCGGVILAGAKSTNGGVGEVIEIYPRPAQVDANLPNIAKEYLTQAINSLHAPAGSVMLCASAVDAMLKDKGYTTGNLYTRINKAAEDHLITQGMKDWAHEIRLDANDQRHADQDASLPTTADAQRSVEFAQALGQFLFALPARVAQGRAAAQATLATPANVSIEKASPGVTQADVATHRTSAGR